MKDTLRDLVRSTSGFGFDAIKATTTADETKFEAVNADRTVIMKARTKAPITEIEGVLGLPDLSTLSGILGLGVVQDDATQIEVSKNANGDYTKFEFKGPDFKGAYPLMSERAVPNQPNFKGVAWDASVEVTKGGMVALKEQHAVFGKDGKFTPVADGNKLKFALGGTGNANTANASFTFAEMDSPCNIMSNYEYLTQFTLAAMALVNSADVTIHFSNKGVMQISVDSGLVEYDFIFPGQS